MILPPCAINQIDVDAYTSNAGLVCEYQVVASTVQLPVRFRFQQSRSGLVVSMETETTRSASLMQLHELSELGPNWDGYGADPIDRACVANVAMILAVLPNATPAPELTPNPNGTLSLDWESGQQVLSLEVGVSRYSSFWESANSMETDEGDCSNGLPDFVATMLARLFPRSDWMPSRFEELTIDAQGPTGRPAARYPG